MIDLIGKINEAEISDASKATYRKISRALIKSSVGLKGKDTLEMALSKGGWKNENEALYEIIQDIDEYQPMISNGSNMKALNIYYNTIRALIKHSGDSKLKQMKGEWDLYANEIDDQIREQTDNR